MALVREGEDTRPVSPRLDLCFDFANTLYGRGSIPTDSLHDFAGLIRWCGTKDLLLPSEIADLRIWSQRNAHLAVEVLARASEIRETIYHLFAQLAGVPDRATVDLDELNRAIALAPPRIQVQRVDDGFAWSVTAGRTSAAGLLAPVLWSAGDLLTGPYLNRVRLCANEKCLWLFLDDSLSGRRRWCSMTACGNRAKTRRHYLRRTAR